MDKNKNESREKFSIKARANSFRYAFEGIKSFFKGQHNAWIHLLATTVVIILIIVFRIEGAELIGLILVTGLVWAAELFNTAIEKMMDFISVKEHPDIKFIKDISAAAVLVTAIVALITGCIVFIPKL